MDHLKSVVRKFAVRQILRPYLIIEVNFLCRREDVRACLFSRGIRR